MTVQPATLTVSEARVNQSFESVSPGSLVASPLREPIWRLATCHVVTLRQSRLLSCHCLPLIWTLPTWAWLMSFSTMSRLIGSTRLGRS